MRAQQLPAHEQRWIEIQAVAGCTHRSNAPAFLGGAPAKISDWAETSYLYAPDSDRDTLH